MTDGDLLLDGDNVVADGNVAGTVVVRISRTAAGMRTWTVGATAPLGTSADDVIPVVLAYDDALALLTGTRGNGSDVGDGVLGAGEQSLTDVLARSILMAQLSKAPADPERYPDGWVTTAQLGGVGGSRAKVVRDLQALARAGMVEYLPGGGRGKQSLYRAIPKAGNVTPIRKAGKA